MRGHKTNSEAHELKEKYLETPVGMAVIETCELGIHKIKLVQASPDTNPKNVGTETEIEKEAVEWLEEYFKMNIKKSKADFVSNPEKYPPICWSGMEKSDFGVQVLKTALEKVCYGETVSYKQLAELAGNAGASRAVGTALKNNPVWIIIPCHRIIKSDGSSGNYAGGTRNDVKQWLINFENENKNKVACG